MFCENSENCTYYRTYRYKPNFLQHRLIVENYCEGSLKSTCRRQQYEVEYCKRPPEELAPNGYLVGTNKKLKIKNTRKFERYKIKNCACLLQVLGTKKTFSAWIIDISEEGVRLDLNVHLDKVDISSKTSSLKILGYSIDAIPFPLTKEIVKPVWQNDQEMGCSFVTSPA